MFENQGNSADDEINQETARTIVHLFTQFLTAKMRTHHICKSMDVLELIREFEGQNNYSIRELALALNGYIVPITEQIPNQQPPDLSSQYGNLRPFDTRGQALNGLIKLSKIRGESQLGVIVRRLVKTPDGQFQINDKDFGTGGIFIDGIDRD